MRRIDGFYEELAESPSADADYILGAALEHAEPGWFERIEGLLAKRDNDLARGALLGCNARLTPAVRKAILKDPDQFTAALAHTVKLPSAVMRESGLLLLAEHCKLSLTYLLPAALRDSVARNRAAAARALETVARAVREKDDQVAQLDAATLEAHNASRMRLVMTIREALGIFERYPQLEILRVACWYSPDLSRPLWHLLENHNGKAGATLFRKLPEWNDPFLAEFLLRSLGRPRWRSDAAKCLQEWSDPEAVASLLALSEVLEDSGIRDGLAHVRFPVWFRCLDERLSQLPAVLRPLAPAWVLATGIRGDQKQSLLESWRALGDAELRQAASDALEIFSTSGAAARRDSTSALRKAAAATPPTPMQETRPTPTPTPPESTSPISDPDDDFEVLWSCCRKLPARQRVELIGLLREQAIIFSGGLRNKLTSGDARDRILGLQIIGTRELGEQFLADLAMLQQDTVDAIRSLASGAVEELQRQVGAFDAAHLTPAGPIAGQRVTSGDRRRLEQKLQELTQDVALGANEAFIAELQAEFRNAYSFAAHDLALQEQGQ